MLYVNHAMCNNHIYNYVLWLPLSGARDNFPGPDFNVMSHPIKEELAENYFIPIQRATSKHK